MTTRTLATPKPPRITLDTLPQLFAHWRDRTGPLGMTMEDTGGGDGGDDAAAAAAKAKADADAAAAAAKAKADADAAAAAGGGAGGGAGGAGAAAPKKIELTQEELDAMIGKRLGTEKAKYEQQIKDLQESAGKTEVEKITAERDRFKEQAEGAPKVYGPKLAQSEAKLAAMVAKGRTDRLAQIVKQADLTDAVGDDGEIDEAKVKTAIEKVLTDFPEWKATAGASGTDLGSQQDGTQKPTFTRKQIEEMSDEERIKRLDEINLALAEGRISG